MVVEKLKTAKEYLRAAKLNLIIHAELINFQFLSKL